MATAKDDDHDLTLGGPAAGGNGSNGAHGEVPLVKVSVGGGKVPKTRVENQEALDALAALGGAPGSAIIVTRNGPAVHEGRRVQLGNLNIGLTVDDLKDPVRLHALLGPRGREFLISVGGKSIRYAPVGGDLSLLDYEPEDQSKAPPTMTVLGPGGLPMAVPIPQAPAAPTWPFLPPWGMPAAPAAALTPEVIAKAVAEALGSSKRDAEAEEKRLAREQARWDREDRERREDRDRREKEEKERHDRDDRDRKEERDRRDREERDRKDREEKDAKERAAREERYEKERQRQHDVEMARIDAAAKTQVETAKTQAEAAVNAAKAAAAGQKDFFEQYVKLREMEAPGKDEKDPLERAMEMFDRLHKATNPRSVIGEIMHEAQPLVKEFGEQLRSVKATPPALPGPSAPGTPSATTPAGTPPPGGGRLTSQELVDGLGTVRDAIAAGYAPAQIVPLLKRPRPNDTDGQRGTPNLVAVCASQEPMAFMAELQRLYAAGEDVKPWNAPDTSEGKTWVLNARKTLETFSAIALTDAGKAWLTEFWKLVRA